MEKKEILQQMNGIFCKVFKRDDLVIRESTNANDIEEWDSLNHVMLITSIENHFGVKFMLKEIIRFKNVGDTVDCLFEKLK